MPRLPRELPRLPRDVPHLPTRRRPARPAAGPPPRVIVLGDLMLDVVLAPERPLEQGTDVPGRVLLRQGGSAATTARWLARLGVRTTLICAVGRDVPGRALTARLAADQVKLAALRVPGVPTGRIGVVLGGNGERTFVADRGAADRLTPDDVKADWFADVDVLHLPAYSLLTAPLGDAARAAIGHARARNVEVTLDLASAAPLLARGRRAAVALVRACAPDLLFATLEEAEALTGSGRPEGLIEYAPLAVVKRGRHGATVLAGGDGGTLRLEVATRPLPTTDTTGAGDAFDAGFLAAWLDARRRGLARTVALKRGAVAGNRAAARQLSRPAAELSLG